MHERNRIGQRGEELIDLLMQTRDARVDEVDVGQDLRDQDPVLWLHAPLQGLPQRRQLRPQASAGQLRQDRRIVLPRDERLEHRPSADPEYRAGDGCELEVGRFQDFVQVLLGPDDLRYATR